VWDLRRSRLSLQERELEPVDNIFIIHPNSNHNYKNFTVGSYQVGSGIGSFSIESFRISGRIKSGRVGYQVI
jgi:hypothetical protein